MAVTLLHSHAPPTQSIPKFPPFSTFSSGPLSISLAHPSSVTRQRYPLFTTANPNNSALSLTIVPRKLLCKPPQGKHVREDYLVLAVDYESNAMIVKVDTDDEYEFARDMQVRGLPTLFFVSPDPKKDAIRTEGLIPIQMMRDILDKEM